MSASLPRTPRGDPDLQGIWTSGYILTPLERPERFADREFLTDEEVAALEQEAALTFGVGAGAGEVHAARGAPRRTYLARNDVFAGRGRKVVRTKRSSLIVDPGNGKIPPLTSAGHRSAALRVVAGRPGGRADGPEDRRTTIDVLAPVCPLRPRSSSDCRRAQSNRTGSGVLSIYYEQNRGGTYRSIPIDGRPSLPSNVRQWLGGDARGRWEENTLVVDTTNFTDRTNYYGSREHLHLVERFTRIALDVDHVPGDDRRFVRRSPHTLDRRSSLDKG